MGSTFFPLPEHAVYLDDKRAPAVESWEWIITLEALEKRFAEGDISYLSLNFNLGATDPSNDGESVLKWMHATNNWPREYLQLHTGDYIGRDKMCAVIDDSRLFAAKPIQHPLGYIYPRLNLAPTSD